MLGLIPGVGAMYNGQFFKGLIHVVVFAVLVYACTAGRFVVPIFAAVQSWAGEDRRARVVGAVNTLSAIFMVVGSLATTLLLKLGGLSESAAIVLLGVANFAAAAGQHGVVLSAAGLANPVVQKARQAVHFKVAK